MDGLDREIVAKIQRVLSQVNPFVEVFLRAGEFIRSQESVNVRLAIHKAPGVDLRTHNCPTCNNVAAILLDDNMGAERDIILHFQDGGLQRICDTHPAYDPLHFPLLFPHGELGWHLAVQYHGDATIYNNKVSCRECAAYRLYIKANAYSLLHCAARLFLQWCVEEYVKTEQHSLPFIRQNHVNIRADLYHGIRDMALQDHDLAHVGTFIVLPATFNGGERYMRQQYQDAMAVVRMFGKKDLFITVTCNLQWPEVINNLLPNQHPGDRPDTLARVFRLKLEAILDDLLKKNCLGIVMAYYISSSSRNAGFPTLT
jgi:hypothetical protein